MSTTAVSDRTIVRDVIVSALENRQGADGVRIQEFEVSKHYLTEQDCKGAATYCVIVTDETPAEFTQRDMNCEMTVKLVLYVKHESDARAVLDAAIEDVYETMLLVQESIKETAWKFTMTDLTTDEGTVIAKPYAQAIQRWTCHHGRATRAA